MDFLQLKTNLIEIGLCQDNEYLDKYIQLIIDNQYRKKEKFKTDNHHIIPRYFFHSHNQQVKDEDNLVVLLTADHILAHYYLCFCSSNHDYQIANINSVRFSCNKDFERFENVSEEWLKENLPRYAELDSISRAEQSRKAKLNIGEKNPFYGKHHTEETKEKISKKKKGRALSEEHKEKLRRLDHSIQIEAMRQHNLNDRDYTGQGEKISKTKKENNSGNNRKNKIKITDGTNYKYVTDEELNFYLNTGWVYGYGAHYKHPMKKGIKKWVYRVLEDGSIERKQVVKEEVNKYLEVGWLKGHGIKNQYERRHDL